MIEVVNLILLSIGLTSLVWWVRAMIGHRNRLTRLFSILVPARSRELPFWNAGDALIMFGLMQMFVGLFLAVLIWQGFFVRPPDGELAELSSGEKLQNLKCQVGATLLGGMLAMTLVLAMLRARSPLAIEQLGLTVTAKDIVFGLKAAVMILPPVLLLSSLVSILIEYEHPVLEILQSLRQPSMFALIFISTAIITPIVEEFLFRVLLIGGLERLEFQFRRPRTQTTADDEPPQSWQPQSFWPIMISSLIFALLHFGQGGAPIPLFVLALGLGYLYRRTGQMIGPVIVHMVLNGTTLIAEVVRLNS